MVQVVFSIIEEALRLFRLSYLKFATQIQPSSGLTIELEYDFTILGYNLKGNLRCSLSWKGMYRLYRVVDIINICSGILEAVSDLAIGKLKEYIAGKVPNKNKRNGVIDFTAIEAPVYDVCSLSQIDSRVLEFIGYVFIIYFFELFLTST